MKSNLDKLEGLNRKLSIEIPENMVNNAFNRVYQGLQKNSSIKGFRKGKAPISTIKSLYQDRVKSDVLQDLISENYQKALKEHSITPLGQPNIQFDDLNENKSFQFSAEFEIRPEVNLKKYENLKIKKESNPVTNEQINEALDNIRKSRSTNTPVLEDRRSENGDILELDFAGFIGDEPLENGAAKNQFLELGSHSFIEGFEEGLVGSKAGDEKELNLKFPDDYHAKDIAGKAVRFAVKIHKIHKKELPELNDEFAATLSPEFKTVDDLKAAIRKDLEANEENRVKEELKTGILKELVKENPVDVPAGLREKQKEALIKDVEQKMKGQGMSQADFEDYKKKWDKDFSETADFMIQSNFLIEEIADKHNLHGTANEVNAKIQEQALQTGLDLEKIKEYYQSSNKISYLQFQITEEKVVDYLLSKADIQ